MHPTDPFSFAGAVGSRGCFGGLKWAGGVKGRLDLAHSTQPIVRGTQMSVTRAVPGVSQLCTSTALANHFGYSS